MASGRVANTMNVRDSRLPRWAAASYLAITLSIVGYYLYETRELWPVAAQCEWCACSRDGTTLYTCRHAAHVNTIGGLYMIGVGLTTIRPNAFQAPILSSIPNIDLSYNAISSIEPGTFDGLSSVTYLALPNNALSAIQSGAFDGLSALESLDLSGNPLRTIEPGVFAGLPNFKLLMLGGEVSCSSVQTELPAGAQCVDAGCDPSQCSGHCGVSWNAARDECTSKSKQLCSVAQLCSGDPPFDGFGFPGREVLFVPVADGVDEWVQYGELGYKDDGSGLFVGNSKCRLWSELYAPDHHPCGTDWDPQPYPGIAGCPQSAVYCCPDSSSPTLDTMGVCLSWSTSTG